MEKEFDTRKLPGSRISDNGSGKKCQSEQAESLDNLPAVFKQVRATINSVFERDPAARSTLEIILCYPGVHAVLGHQISHWLWAHRLKLLARWFSQLMRALTGIEIHPGAKIGPKLFIDHGMGVVIGETAEIGSCVTLYHGVTLGGTSLEKEKRHPTLEDNVVVGAGAKVLGAITVGTNSRIGANAVVVKSVPPNSVVVGVPGQVVSRSQMRPTALPDLEHGRLPDTIGETLVQMIARLEKVERKLDGDEPLTHIHAPEGGVWHGEDFSI
jgi:serine O-acetyltransferase